MPRNEKITKYPLLEVVALSAAVYRARGDTFVRSLDWDNTSNVDLMRDHLSGETKVDILPEDYNSAQDIITYLKGLVFDAIVQPLNDFSSATLNLVSADEVSSRQLGLVASFPSVTKSKRNRDKLVMRQRELALTSEFVGDLKTRGKFDLTLEFIQDMASFDSFLHIAIDQDNNVVTWFSNKMRELSPGDKVSVEGFVNKHQVGPYRAKETMLNRVKLISIE